MDRIVNRLTFSFFLVSFCFYQTAFSQGGNEEKKYTEMSLEQLMDIPISVASNKATTVRRAPAAVALITSDDIRRLGARDLAEVLRTVPGFYTTFSFNTLFSMQFRGSAGGVSKILWIIDDIPFNDDLYGDTSVGRRFPIDVIDRIEVMRGPGSAKYGGLAGMAVIKITTKQAVMANSQVHAQLGMQNEGTPEQKIEAMFSKAGEKLNGGVLISARRAGQSEGSATDVTGFSADLKDNTKIEDLFTLSRIGAGKFTGQVLTDHYEVQDIMSFGAFIPETLPIKFGTVAARMNYAFEVSDKFTVSPYLMYKEAKPFSQTGDIASAYAVEYNRKSQRYEAGVNLDYRFSETQNLLVGISHAEIDGTSLTSSVFPENNSKEVSMEETGLYTEFYADVGLFETTLGARYDKGLYGDKIVPRLALVKQMDSWGTKLIYTEGFRSPLIENYFSNVAGNFPDPETIKLTEFELSKKINSHSQATLNLYYVEVENPLIFNSSGFNYENVSLFDATTGAELSYEYRDPKNIAKFSVDYAWRNPAPRWSVPGHDDFAYGAANIHSALHYSYKFNDNYSVSPTLLYEGAKYSYEWTGAAQEAVKFKETIYANLILERRNLFMNDMTLAIGIYNIGDADYRSVDGAGQVGSLPHQSTTYAAKLSAEF